MTNIDLMTWAVFGFLLIVFALTVFAVPALIEWRYNLNQERETRIIENAVWEAMDAYTGGEIEKGALLFCAVETARNYGVKKDAGRKVCREFLRMGGMK